MCLNLYIYNIIAYGQVHTTGIHACEKWSKACAPCMYMLYTSIHVYMFTLQAVRFQGLGLGFLCAHFDMGSAATAVKMRVARMPELLDRGDAIYTSAGGSQGNRAQ